MHKTCLCQQQNLQKLAVERCTENGEMMRISSRYTLLRYAYFGWEYLNTQVHVHQYYARDNAIVPSTRYI